MTLREKWKCAKPMSNFWAKHNGETYPEAMKHLKRIGYEMAAYGDWYLYEEDDGTLYEDYFSIGD